MNFNNKKKYRIYITSIISIAIGLMIIKHIEKYDFNAKLQLKTVFEKINYYNSKEMPINRNKNIDKIGFWLSKQQQKFLKINHVNANDINNKKLVLEWIDRVGEKDDKLIFVPYHSIYKLHNFGGNLPQDSQNIFHTAKNAYQSCQFIFATSSNSLCIDSIVFSKPAFLDSTFELFAAKSVFLRKPTYKAAYSGYVDDALLIIDSVKKSKTNCVFYVNKNIENEIVQTFWLNMYIPKKSKTGSFELEYKVYAHQNIEKITHSDKIFLQIYNVVLPQQKPLKTSFSFNYDLYKYYFKIYPFDFNQRKRIYDFLLSYHLSPTFVYRYDYLFPPISDWDYCINKGATAFCLAHTEFLNKDSTQFITDYSKLKKMFLDKYAYIYGVDEVNHIRASEVRECYNYLKSNKVNLPLATTNKFIDSLNKYIDIWMVLQKDWTAQKANSILKNNPKDEIWWYISESAQYPYPSYFTDAMAVEPRLLCWQAFMHNIAGLQYYETILWQSNFIINKTHPLYYDDIFLHHDSICLKQLEQGKRFPEVEWNSYTWENYNGDGQLIYPAKNTGLLPSIRLINIRDGIQDHALLVLLDEKYKALKINPNKNKQSLKRIENLIKEIDFFTKDIKQINNQSDNAILNLKEKLLKELE